MPTWWQSLVKMPADNAEGPRKARVYLTMYAGKGNMHVKMPVERNVLE